MARIRTIKPEFFRHEGLQDLEIANPGMYPMMVFEGLWGHCDSKGRFEWRPRQLKLDILPFLNFDMTTTLAILADAGMVNRYTVDGKEYGEIPTFEKHQRISGKELQEGEKHPGSTGEASEKQPGSTGEIPEFQEGKGREQEGKGVNLSLSELAAPVADRCPPCPIQRIVEIYHEELPSLTRCVAMNATREGYLRQRWRECFKDGDFATIEEGLVRFREYFQHVAQSDFLCGKTAPNGRRPFLADLEWLTKPNNFLKVLEGKYHAHKHTH